MTERMTERTANGGVKYSDEEYYKICYPQNEHCLKDVDRMAIKLCEIEDKIEQGKIVEFPCAVGQTVYYISRYWTGIFEVYECIVDHISLYSGNAFVSIIDKNDRSKYFGVNIQDGYLFFDKKDAYTELNKINN